MLSRRFVWDYVSYVSTTLFDSFAQYSIQKATNFVVVVVVIIVVVFSFFNYFQCGMCSQEEVKISPVAYIFQRPFLGGLFLEGLIFGGAYVRREICVSKSIGLTRSWKEIYHFCFVLLCIREQIPCTSPPGGLYSEGRFSGGFFALGF